ncbi:LPXTG cell wall anchor domain-containing protein [Microbacterium sp. SSM24]|uniref:LPXTG cell wall anchor domain-containing protein n=1 Tax=Microbacterium sp. SSM24 TaxID=2991714 RepID=UPI0022269876|nr:LPXTG cell wall anchor domain-containing protein [Microbacterium sp. SSM24]MCW3494597.1 LPXTG cell wall anchor domain-containing protein [Microbacterium sp. SSM24]
MIAVAAFIAVSTPMAASAVEEDPYTPHEPTAATLAGSVAVGECVADVPYIHYDITLTDPDEQSTGNVASLVLSSGSNIVTVPLGTLVDNHLSGTVLWPGASVDDEGNPSGWPGWAFVDGTWVETSGNFAWTRGSISAVIKVNPELSVPLSYPAATPNCATTPPTALSPESPASVGDPALAATGGSLPYIAAGVGVALVGLGAAVVVYRRRSARS